MNRDQTKGRLDQAGGKIKEEVGELVNDPDMARRGRADKDAGRAQADLGDAREEQQDARDDAARRSDADRDIGSTLDEADRPTLTRRDTR